MGDYFLNYLATADGKQRLMNGLSEVIDMDQLESQLSATMGSYMAKAMGTYTRAISDVLETQITSAMNQIVTQITEKSGTPCRLPWEMWEPSCRTCLEVR